MLPDLTRRITAVATSVVTLVTGLAVLFNAFVAEVTPSLPDGWQDNAAAIGLYESVGFAAVGVRKRYYRVSGADAYTMRREAT